MLVRSLLVASAAALLMTAPGPAAAHSHYRVHRVHPAVPHAAARAGDARRGPVPQNARYGYSENPYDPAYRGPGWEVFALQHGQERTNRLLHDVAPDAKISASGIVVGGD